MDGNLVGLAAVIMIFGIPMAAMYTFYHVRKLRTDERLAALARGVNVLCNPSSRGRPFATLRHPACHGSTRLHAYIRAHRKGRVGCLDGCGVRDHPAQRRHRLFR